MSARAASTSIRSASDPPPESISPPAPLQGRASRPCGPSSCDEPELREAATRPVRSAQRRPPHVTQADSLTREASPARQLLRLHPVATRRSRAKTPYAQRSSWSAWLANPFATPRNRPTRGPREPQHDAKRGGRRWNTPSCGTPSRADSRRERSSECTRFAPCALASRDEALHAISDRMPPRIFGSTGTCWPCSSATELFETGSEMRRPDAPHIRPPRPPYEPGATTTGDITHD